MTEQTETLTEVTTVVRSHALRFVERASLVTRSSMTSIDPEVLAALPRLVTPPRWSSDKAATWAITGAYVEHTWSSGGYNPSGWAQRRKLVGLRLNANGEVSKRGYGGEHGIAFTANAVVPEAIVSWWESHPIPTAVLRIEEQS